MADTPFPTNEKAMTAIKTHGTVYRTTRSLMATQMFTPENLVQITDSSGVTAIYHVAQDQETLYNLDTGQRSHINEFTNRRVVIATIPAYRQVTAHQVGQVAAIRLKETIKNRRIITVGTYDSAHEKFKDIKHEAMKSINTIEADMANQIEAADKAVVKKAGAIDLETYIGREELKGSQRVVVGSISEVEDHYLTSTKRTFDRIRTKRMARSWEYFDLKTLEGWSGFDSKKIQDSLGTRPTSGENIFVQMNKLAKGKSVKGSIGKQQLGLFLEAMTERKKTQLRQEISNLEINELRNRELMSSNRNQLSRLENATDLVEMSIHDPVKPDKIMNQAQEYGERFLYLKDDINQVLKLAKANLKQTSLEMAQDKSYTEAMKRQYGFSFASSPKMYGGAPNTSSELVNFYITDDPLYSLSRKGNELGYGLTHYRSMEPDRLKEEYDHIFDKRRRLLEKARQTPDKALRKELRVEAKVSNYKMRAISQTLGQISDAEPMIRATLSSMTTDLKNIGTSSKSGIESVLSTFEIPQNIKTTILETLDVNLTNPNLSDLSQEFLVRTVSDYEFQASHISSGDNAAAAAFMLDKIDTNLPPDATKPGQIMSPHAKRISSYLPSARARGFAKITYAQDGAYELSNKVVSNLHAAQTTTGLLRELDKGALTKLLNHPSSSVDPTAVDHMVTSFLSERDAGLAKNVNKRTQIFGAIEDIINQGTKRQYENTSSQFRTFLQRQTKAKTNNPAIVSKMMSGKMFSRYVAWLAVAKLINSTAMPGEKIDRGQHAGLETVARRIASSDFNSAMKVPIYAMRTAIKALSRYGTRIGIKSERALATKWVDDGAEFLGAKHDTIIKTLEARGLGTIKTIDKSAKTRALKQTATLDDEAILIHKSFNKEHYETLGDSALKYKKFVEKKAQQSVKRMAKEERRHKLVQTISEVRKYKGDSSPMSVRKKYVNVGDPRGRVDRLTRSELVEKLHYGHRFQSVKHDTTPMNQYLMQGGYYGHGNFKKKIGLEHLKSTLKGRLVKDQRKLIMRRTEKYSENYAVFTESPVLKNIPVLSEKRSLIPYPRTGTDVKNAFVTRKSNYNVGTLDYSTSYKTPPHISMLQNTSFKTNLTTRPTILRSGMEKKTTMFNPKTPSVSLQAAKSQTPLLVGRTENITKVQTVPAGMTETKHLRQGEPIFRSPTDIKHTGGSAQSGFATMIKRKSRYPDKHKDLYAFTFAMAG